MPDTKTTTKSFRDMYAEERREALAGKRIHFHQPAKTTGCRLRRHPERESDATVIETSFAGNDCAVRTDKFGYQFIRYEHIIGVIED